MFSAEEKQSLNNFANASDVLFDYGIINTDSFTGEIGEYFACILYNLQRTTRSTKAVDCISAIGEKYQVKSKIITQGYNYNIANLHNNLFDYLVVVYFDKNYLPQKILKIPSKKIINNKIAITKLEIECYEDKSLLNIKYPNKVKKALERFAISYNLLQTKNIIKTRRIVGDIGEFYASKRLNLILSLNSIEKGYDAKDKNGFTYEIKTRRVYNSGRRISENRRINNLVGKNADFLIIVTLDRDFTCSGMWIMPMKNVINPKSANLKIVNNTAGVLNLIPSKIHYLNSGSKFISLDNLSIKNNNLKKGKVVVKTIEPKSNVKLNEQKSKNDLKKIHFELFRDIIIILVVLFLIYLIGISFS